MSLESEVQKLTEASNSQTAASQELTQEVAGKMGEVDSKVNQKMAEMDDKISQATGDVAAAVADLVDIVIYIDSTPGVGSPDNSGDHVNSPLDTIENAFKKIIDGTTALISLKGAGARYVLNKKIITKNTSVMFSGHQTNGVRPVVTHSAKNTGDNIEANSFLLRGGANFLFYGVDIETSRWQDWVSSGNKINYLTPLFSTHSNYGGGGRVTINQANITINNSPLFQQHTSGTVGWLDKIAILYATVTKRDLSNDVITDGFQYLIDQYGAADIPWDFSTIALTIDSGETLPELISSNVKLLNVRSSVPLTVS